MKINIDRPHGYFLDNDNRVVLRFGGWKVGEHEVPKSVASVEYVDGSAAHDRDIHWMYGSGVPPITISLSSKSIKNNGTDSVDVNVSLDADAEESRDVKLFIDSSNFSETVTPDSDIVETVITTKNSGSTIKISVDGRDVQQAITEIEVIEA